MTTTTTRATADGDRKDDDEAERYWPLYYLPNRDIPPIAPTPPSDCPLGRRRRTVIVSRQYDITSGQPVYRVRVERCVPGDKESREAEGTNGDGRRGRMGWDGGVDGDGTNGGNAEAGRDGADDGAEEHSVGLADILDWVSPAELERFELEWEDDMVFITDEDGAVLLVSREVQRAMIGWPAGNGTEQTLPAPIPPHEAAAADGSPDAAGVAVVSTHAVGPGKIKKMKKKPTKEFVDALPPVRRRGRPPKKMLKTAEVMGVVGGEDRDEVEPEIEPEAELETVETGSETAEYGAWVNPANVRGTAAVPGSADETDELALSEESNRPSGQWRAGGDILSREQSHVPFEHAAGTRRRGRSATASTASSHARRRRATPSNVAPPSNMSLTASPVRQSTSTRGARLRRSSISSSASTAQSFHSASSQRRSLRSSRPPSRSGSEARANDRATSLLSASNFTRQPRSQQETEESDPIADLNATPHASQSTVTGIQGSKRRHSSATIPTPSTRHQASSMLHPPAEGASWEPESEEEEEYEIESIIEHEFYRGEWYYLVKWANWPPDDVSWFREEQLADARDVLDRYLESVKRKKERTESKKGKERAVEAEDEDGDVDMIA